MKSINEEQIKKWLTLYSKTRDSINANYGIMIHKDLHQIIKSFLKDNDMLNYTPETILEWSAGFNSWPFDITIMTPEDVQIHWIIQKGMESLFKWIETPKDHFHLKEFQQLINNPLLDLIIETKYDIITNLNIEDELMYDWIERLKPFQKQYEKNKGNIKNYVKLQR